MSKNGVVIQQQGAAFDSRIAAIRAEADERHLTALTASRTVVDARIAELVQYRVLAAVDAVLLPK